MGLGQGTLRFFFHIHPMLARILDAADTIADYSSSESNRESTIPRN